MKRIALFLVMSLLLTAALGCGGGEKRDASSEDALSLLMESSQAMSALSGYRMNGTMEMGMGNADAGGGSLSMEMAGEVDNTGESPAQHITVKMGTVASEAYIVGDYYYQEIPGQGWIKMDVAQYRAQNVSMGMVDSQQWKSIAEAAEDIAIDEETEEETVISLKLGEEFFRMSFESYRESLSEEERAEMQEWIDYMEESTQGFSARIRLWIGKGDRLVRRMEMSYRMQNAQVGSMTGVADMEITDYNADIHVTLPEGAEGAREFSPSTIL